MEFRGINYSLLKDYDKGKYAHLKFAEKVEYLRARVEFILIEPSRAIVAKAGLKDGTPLGNLGLVLATGLCAGISAAGTYLKGRRAQKRGEDEGFFVDFIRTYMDPVLQSNNSLGTTWATWIYKEVRCGLAHAFVIENGGIEYEVQGYVEEKPYGPEINPSRFLEDFASGWQRYLGDVTKDGQGIGVGSLFEARFDQVFSD